MRAEGFEYQQARWAVVSTDRWAFKPEVGVAVPAFLAGILLAVASALSGWLHGTVLSISVLSVLAGVVLSLAGGIGLMTLVFYSARRGYDDAAHNEQRRRIGQAERVGLLEVEDHDLAAFRVQGTRQPVERRQPEIIARFELRSQSHKPHARLSGSEPRRNRNVLPLHGRDQEFVLFGIAVRKCQSELQRRPEPVLSLHLPGVAVPVAATASPIEAAIATETAALIQTASQSSLTAGATWRSTASSAITWRQAGRTRWSR